MGQGGGGVGGGNSRTGGKDLARKEEMRRGERKAVEGLCVRNPGTALGWKQVGKQKERL